MCIRKKMEFKLFLQNLVLIRSVDFCLSQFMYINTPSCITCVGNTELLSTYNDLEFHPLFNQYKIIVEFNLTFRNIKRALFQSSSSQIGIYFPLMNADSNPMKSHSNTRFKSLDNILRESQAY